jgi:Na+/H+-dicarboxylate symporter
MTLLGPNEKDVLKLNAEVTQVIKQRINLNTATVTVFGIILAWLIPKQDLSQFIEIGAFIYFGTCLLLVLLFVFYWISYRYNPF